MTMLPSRWVTFCLGDVCRKIGSGATPRGGSGVYLDSGDVALIRSQNVHNDGFHHDGIAYLTEEHAAELENVEVQEDDVLLNITGDSVARCCQVDPQILPARVNQHVAIIRSDPKQLDPRFLRYFLVCPDMQARMLSLAGAGGTRNALTKGMIESFEVPAPTDVREQRAIAAVLGALDDKIELNRRMCRTLEGIARAIFQSWFVDFDPVRWNMERKGAKPPGRKAPHTSPASLRPGDLALNPSIAALFPDRFEDSPLGPIPKGWKCGPLPDFIDVNPPRALRKGEVAPYLDMANMPTRTHAPETWIQRPAGSGMRFINGDTLVARITPCLENGKTAYVDFLGEGQVGWGSTEYIVLRPKPPLPAVFAYCLARGDEFRSYAIQRMTGSSGRQRVPHESLQYFVLAVPSEPVAKMFGNLADPLFIRSRICMEQSRSLGALRDALLPKLVSGELRIGDVERIIGRCA